MDVTNESQEVTDEMIREEAASRLSHHPALCKLSDGELALAMMLSLSAQLQSVGEGLVRVFTTLSEVLEMMDKAALRPEPAESIVEPVTDPDHYA